MIYITGDTHGDFHRFNRLNFNDENVMIVLGDVGINYYLDEYDKKLKECLSKYNFNYFVYREITKKDQKIFQVIMK